MLVGLDYQACDDNDDDDLESESVMFDSDNNLDRSTVHFNLPNQPSLFNPDDLQFSCSGSSTGTVEDFITANTCSICDFPPTIEEAVQLNNHRLLDGRPIVNIVARDYVFCAIFERSCTLRC